MRIIRVLGHVALWIAAALGVLAGGVWVAGQLGVLQPLIVISGSMEPTIGTGDLLIARSTPTSELEVGDVVSLHSEMTQKLVTHRITEITRADDGTWQIGMKGDANDEPDLEVYSVGDTTWTPVVRIPQGGDVAARLMDPAVSLPILLTLLALLGLSLLDDGDRARASASRARIDTTDPDDDDAGVTDATVVEVVDDDLFAPHDAFLAELDVELAMLGVDMATIDRFATVPTG